MPTDDVKKSPKDEADDALQNGNKKSLLTVHNITVNKRRTSVRLEPSVWQALNEISRREKISLNNLCSLIAQHTQGKHPLTSSIRVFVLQYFRTAATEEGHMKAGHGNRLMLDAGARISSFVKK